MESVIVGHDEHATGSPESGDGPVYINLLPKAAPSADAASSGPAPASGPPVFFSLIPKVKCKVQRSVIAPAITATEKDDMLEGVIDIPVVPVVFETDEVAEGEMAGMGDDGVEAEMANVAVMFDTDSELEDLMLEEVDAEAHAGPAEMIPSDYTLDLSPMPDMDEDEYNV